jgi:hypothetical protein
MSAPSFTDIYLDVPDGRYIDFGGDDGARRERLYSNASTVGIGNAWAVGVWTMLRDAEDRQVMFQIMDPGSPNTNHIRFLIWADYFWIRIGSSAGVVFKDYQYNMPMLSVWHHLLSTWNGTTLMFYLDGLEYEPLSRGDDDSGSMTDTSRVVYMGGHTSSVSQHYNGLLHSVCVFADDFVTADVRELYNGGSKNIDPRSMSKGSLCRHWWRLGHRHGTYGAGQNYSTDWVTSGGINIDANNQNVTDADVFMGDRLMRGTSVQLNDVLDADGNVPDALREVFVSGASQTLGVANSCYGLSPFSAWTRISACFLLAIDLEIKRARSLCILIATRVWQYTSMTPMLV